MVDAWFNYQYTNILGFLIFALVSWLAFKSDVAKDVLALLFLALLLVPVPIVMYVHYSKNDWFSFFFCALIQAGLTYASYVFIKYMYNYHKSSKYIFWEK